MAAPHNLSSLVFLLLIAVLGTAFPSVIPTVNTQQACIRLSFGTPFRLTLVVFSRAISSVKPFEPDLQADAAFNAASEFIYNSLMHLRQSNQHPGYFDDDARRHLRAVWPDKFSDGWDRLPNLADIFFAYYNLLERLLCGESLDLAHVSEAYCPQCWFYDATVRPVNRLVLSNAVTRPSQIFNCTSIQHWCRSDRCLHLLLKRISCRQSLEVREFLHGTPKALFVTIPKNRKKTDYTIEPRLVLYGDEEYVLETVLLKHTREGGEETNGLSADMHTISLRSGGTVKVSCVGAIALTSLGLLDPEKSFERTKTEIIDGLDFQPQLLIYVRRSAESSSINSCSPSSSSARVAGSGREDTAKNVFTPSADELNAAMAVAMPILHCFACTIPSVRADSETCLLRVLYALQNRLSVPPEDLYHVLTHSNLTKTSNIPAIQRLFELLSLADRDKAGMNSVVLYSTECRCCGMGPGVKEIQPVVLCSEHFRDENLLESLADGQIHVHKNFSATVRKFELCPSFKYYTPHTYYRHMIRMPTRCLVIDIGVNSNRRLLELQKCQPQKQIGLDGKVGASGSCYDMLQAFLLQAPDGSHVAYLRGEGQQWHKMEAPRSEKLVAVEEEVVKPLFGGSNVEGGPRYLFYCKKATFGPQTSDHNRT